MAEDTLSLANELEVNLPGTKAAFRSGLLNQRKAAIIAAATCLLDPAEARAAEAKVLDRAGALTPPALRAAIQRAVMQVAPEKAKQRREHAAKQTRVERWSENVRQRGPGRPRTPARRSPGRRSAGHRLGRGSCARLAWTAVSTRCGPEHSWTSCSAWTPGPPASAADGTREPQAQAQPAQPLPRRRRAAGRGDPARVRRARHPHRPRGHRDRPDGPARRADRARAGRSRPGPGPGRPPRPATPGPPGASRSPTSTGTPWDTAAPGPSDAENPAVPPHPASPSPVPTTRDRPADTEPGGSPPGTRTCSSRSARPPETATIATKHRATIPGSCSVT